MMNKSDRLDVWFKSIDSKFQALKTRLSAFFDHRSVSHTKIEKEIPNPSMQAVEISPKKRVSLPARTISKSTPASGSTNAEASIKAEAMLELEVPHHRIVSSHLTEEKVKTEFHKAPEDSASSKDHELVTTFHAAVSQPGDEYYDHFMSGWKKLAGPQTYTRELIRLDKASHQLKVFLASHHQPPSLSELQKMSESLSSLKSKLASLSEYEQQAVSNYLAATEELVSAATEQIHLFRDQIVRAFLSSNKVFDKFCSDMKLNPKKDFNLLALQKYDQNIKNVARELLCDSVADLRSRCFEIMVDFALNKDNAARTTTKHTTPALPDHPDASASITIPSYGFHYDGPEIDSFVDTTAKANPHGALLLAIANKWQPDTPLPSLPDVTITPIRKQASDSAISDTEHYKIHVKETAPRDIDTREAELLKSPICSQVDSAPTEQAQIRLANMKESLQVCLKTVCQQAKAPQPVEQLSFKDQLRVLELKKTNSTDS